MTRSPLTRATFLSLRERARRFSACSCHLKQGPKVLTQHAGRTRGALQPAAPRTKRSGPARTLRQRLPSKARIIIIIAVIIITIISISTNIMNIITITGIITSTMTIMIIITSIMSISTITGIITTNTVLYDSQPVDPSDVS